MAGMGYTTYNSSSHEMITKDIIDGLMETVRNLYLADDIPWVIGYSGGKDSTATLQLVWLAIKELPEKQRNKTIHIINTDTLVESPVVARWAQQSLERMRAAAKADGLPFVPHRLIPEYDNTFWVNLIGRGYPFPRKKFRWCTDRLKIQPVNKFVKERIAEHGEIIMVLGTRKAESANRARTMAYYEKKRVRELLSPNPTLVNELVFAPLAEWTDDDVWVFLMQYKNPWGYSNQELLTLYRGATADNECPLMVQKDLPSCGRSRFGCWVCTMVEKDTRVRNGTGRLTRAMTTANLMATARKPKESKPACHRWRSGNRLADARQCLPLYRSVTIPTHIAVQDDPAQERRGTNPPQEDRNVMSPSPVSTGRLHPSRGFHLRPIKHVFNMRATTVQDRTES